LDLSKAAINSFRDFPPQMPDLQTLYLQNNYFSSLIGMPAMPKLVKLDISDNQITSLEGCPSEFPILNELNHSHNQIASFRHFPDTPWLKHLDLSYNRFKTLEEYPKCLRLHIITINIEGNPIETFAGLDSLDLFTVLLKLSNEVLDTFPLEYKERRLIDEAIQFPLGEPVRRLQSFLNIK
jgi:Leucine-rich repeat (LRR) protein